MTSQSQPAAVPRAIRPPLPALLAMPALAAVVALSGCRNAQPGALPAGSTGSPNAAAVVRDSTTFTTGAFDGCPPEGDGGDQDLNRRKNRDLPPPAYQPVTVAEILGNRPSAVEEMGRQRRVEWTASAREAVARWERTGAQVEGYLLKSRHEGPESCNCHSSDDRDFHLWLGADPNDDRANAVVVEVSPRVGARHPGWTREALEALARDRARVRISGWLMWDQEHPEQVGQTRGTLWEVHPIHRIEVSDGGGWRDL